MQRWTLPLTIADWAATEGRFKKHFHPLDADGPKTRSSFNEFFDLVADDARR